MDLAENSVFLEKCPDYSSPNLDECCGRMLGGCISKADLHSKRVLLKPNLISARLGTLACTEGRFILAAARWFADRNARVAIGDSPAFGTSTSVLTRIGVADALRRLPVTIVDFNRVRQVMLPSGLRAGIAAEALDCDLLVNMPRVKAHAQLRVTLAVKNLFGCLVGMRKPLWHMVHGGRHGHFADHLVELLTVLPPSVSLVDGITAMHRSGPIGGEAFPLGIVACSENPVAVDRALLAILGVDPALSPLMVSCAKFRLPGTDINSLEFLRLAPADLAADSFTVPGTLNPIRFDPFRFIRGSLTRAYIKLRSTS